MATIVLTVAQYNAAYKPFAAQDTVVISDTGAAIQSLSNQEFSWLLGNNVDMLNATDNALSLSAAQYNNLGSLAPGASRVSVSPDDYVTLSDWAYVLSTGTLQEISSLAANGVETVDSIDNAITFTVAQYQNVGSVSLTQSDFITLADRGAAMLSLTPADVFALGSKGVDVVDALDGALVLSSASYAALNPFLIAPGDGLKIMGHGQSERIVARQSDDTVKGFGGNDKLYGEAGDDRMYGGSGRDYLSGGLGKDAFVFDTRPGKPHFDKVLDYNVRDDSVWLDNKAFAKLGRGSEANPTKISARFFTIGTEAKDANDYLIYNKKTGALFYDPDGTGIKAAVEVAVLKKGLKLTHHDFFVI